MDVAAEAPAACTCSSDLLAGVSASSGCIGGGRLTDGADVGVSATCRVELQTSEGGSCVNRHVQFAAQSLITCSAGGVSFAFGSTLLT